MAVFAERLPVLYDVPEFGVVREGLLVVSFEVPSLVVAASHACKVVPDEDVVPPVFVLGREPLSATFRNFAVFVRVAGWPAGSPLSHRLAHLPSSFEGMLLAEATFFALQGFADFAAGGLGVGFTLHPRNPSFPAFSDLDDAVSPAAMVKAIRIRPAAVKLRPGFPVFADAAPFESSSQFGEILVRGQATHFGYNFKSTGRCSRH